MSSGGRNYRSGAISDRKAGIALNDLLAQQRPLHVLSGVLHGFDDERARAVLTQCRKAVPSDGRLFVWEYILPERNEPSFGKWLDLHMLVMSGGRERSKSEFEDLLRAGGFRFLGVSKLPTDLCLAEAEPI